MQAVSEDREKLRLAGAYLDVMMDAGAGAAGAWSATARAGGRVLKECGGNIAEAARRLWTAKAERGLDNLRGVRTEFDGMIEPALLEYLWDVEKRGVSAQSVGPRGMSTARPHQSALEAGPQLCEQLLKDAALGRLRLAPGRMATHTEAQSSPVEVGSKTNLDRSVAAERRIVHDQRAVNAWVAAEAHPPVSRPRHWQIARLVSHWRRQHPGLPVHLAKKDIKGAFCLLWGDPQDRDLFAGEVQRKPEWADQGETGGEEHNGDETELVDEFPVVFRALSFGFRGAPGERMAFATGLKQAHSFYGPGRASFEGPERFTCKLPMDDRVLVEPLLGLGPWGSQAVYGDVTTRRLGAGAIDQEKDAVGGQSRTCRTCWGLDCDPANFGPSMVKGMHGDVSQCSRAVEEHDQQVGVALQMQGTLATTQGHALQGVGAA